MDRIIPNGYHKKRRKKRKERPSFKVFHDDPEVTVRFLQPTSGSESDVEITHFSRTTRVLSGPGYHVTPDQALWNVQDAFRMFRKVIGCHRARGKDMLGLHQPGLCPYLQGSSGLVMAPLTYFQGIYRGHLAKVPLGMAQPDWPEQLAQHRQEERAHVKDHAEKVFSCDGADPQLVKQFLRELELVPIDCRLEVLERMARGNLLHEFLHWQRGNNAVPLDQRWGPLRTHTLAVFVSQDTDGTMKKELFQCKRESAESIVSFNRCLRE
ncbi:hypothetical protein CAPTEDRAFT_184881 [Capitella teleta]|uniref:Uncharacterized protein n=1 Tax=Capitella teleta TaxID=283909 RepID=X1ZH73_CAPTE|nr:hypothetical protein CAPTEDRAFT_184881 [Capitella teleta]|eukprot:ELT90096.1 hypothetical protein CAPTEDRAFT_184881 [Capitella teleta]